MATGVWANLAQGTGGEYVHNNNDLKGGFSALGGSPVYYILAFAPKSLKADGTFHPLKVTLAENHKGFAIQARPGYFAPRNDGPTNTAAGIAQNESGATDSGGRSAEHVQHELLQRLVLSKEEVAQLPIDLETKLSQEPDQMYKLSVSTHLDTKSLQFRRDADRNVNALTFVVAIFDPKDVLLEAQQRRANLNVADSGLPDLLKTGLDLTLAFKLRPGAYRVRAAVTDLEQHFVGAASRSVSVPYNTQRPAS
jgi:hypothetical protein